MQLTDHEIELIRFSGIAALDKEKNLRAARMKVVVLCAISLLAGLAMISWL